MYKYMNIDSMCRLGYKQKRESLWKVICTNNLSYLRDMKTLLIICILVGIRASSNQVFTY